MGSISMHKKDEPKLLVHAIEEKAQWLANHTFMRYPTKNWETDGYRSLTWRQFADAINKVAYWLDEQLGKSENIDTIAYLGPTDLRYAVLVPAAVKTNRKVLIPDGRVTSEGLKKLLEETKCKAWIYPEGDENSLLETLDTGLKHCALPSIEWCLDSKGWKRYSYDKTWGDAKFETIIIIHTSGTTGVPKPIYHTNGFHSSGKTHELSRKHWPRGIAYDTWMHLAMLSSCPFQWLGGISAFLFNPVFLDTSCIMPPADAVAFSPAVFKKLLKLNIVDGIMCPPHTITQLYNDPETQPLLKSLKYVVFRGAALDKAVGDDLSEHTKLTSIIGSTETGKQVDLLPVDKKLWHSHDFVPENGNRMIRVAGSGSASDGSDDLYELVLERPVDESAALYQHAFWNPAFNDHDRIETKELYAPVKDADGRTRWIFSARKDDLTKLNWLAKFHAQDIEKRIQEHPDVSSVFVGGEGRPAPYVIIEPKEGVLELKSADALLDELYAGAIARTNTGAIKEVRIPKETVFVAKPAKPFKRSAKHTLMRKEIEKDYSREVEEAYARLATVKA